MAKLDIALGLGPRDRRFKSFYSDHGHVAQLVERLIENQEVTGSSPVVSTFQPN